MHVILNHSKMTGAAIASVAVGAIQLGTGIVQNRKANKAIEEFEFQDQINPYSGLSVSTAGGQLQMEQANRNLATSVNAIGATGSRGLSYLSGATGQAADTARTVGADWDAQQKELDILEARGEEAIIERNARREEAELAGFQTLKNVGMTNMMQGVGGVGNAASVGAQSGAFDGMFTSNGGSVTGVTDPVTVDSGVNSGLAGNVYTNPYQTTNKPASSNPFK